MEIREDTKKKILGLLILSISCFLFLSTPGIVQAQVSSDLLREYLFPLSYGSDVNQNDIIGLRIYKNTDNKDPLTWYQDNVSNPKSTLPEIKVDGYVAVRDDRTVYIQASNLNLEANPAAFYTNIYVLAYNQNASAETVGIFNQMIANMKFNKNIMDIYCLTSQSDLVKNSLRRDTIRKSDRYKMTSIFASASGLNLSAGTYVQNMSISTWPSWQATLGKQLGSALPIDPLNIMSDRLIACTANDQCASGQCSGGYCSACPTGYDARTCWNERELKYHAIDGFVYKYQNGVLTIRYEYPQLQFPVPDPSGKCYLGCNKDGQYYALGSCQTIQNTLRYCAGSVWDVSRCGDGFVRCNEVCEGDNCIKNCTGNPAICTGCLSCEDHYHAEGSLCVADTNDVDSEDFAQTLSTIEKIRWTGTGWSAPYATACVANAILDGVGVCRCKTNYHEEEGTCVLNLHYFYCGSVPPDWSLPANTVWNTVGGYEQDWDGQKWVPVETEPIFSETPATDVCHYKCGDNSQRVGNVCVCDTHYITVNNMCTPDSVNPPIYTCAAKPAVGTEWNNGIGQTFDKTVSGSNWEPADGSMLTEYNETLLASSCRYKCAADFHWDGSACISNTKSYNCPIKTVANTSWNTVSTLTQIWNATTTLWEPVDPLTEYNETAVTDACHYVCNTGFNWTGTECVLCGNGTVNAGEECDDANEINNDACDNSCKFTVWTGSLVVGTTTDTTKYMANGVNLDNDFNPGNSTDEAGGTNIKVSAITPTPYIWIAQSNPDKISKIRTFDGYKVTKDGVDTTTSEVRGQLIGVYDTGGAFPSRTAVNLETGDVWVANRDGHSVRKFDIDGNIKKTCTVGFSSPRGVAIEQNGDVWIANSGADNVVKISGDDSTCPTVFTVGTDKFTVGDYPYGLAIDSDNNVWVVNQGSNSVSKINTITFAITSYYTGGNPYGIAVDKDDNIWIGNYYTGGGVFKVSPSGVVTHIDLPLNYLTTAVTSDSNNNIWISAVNNNCIYKYNQLTSTASDCLSSNGTWPHGIVGDSAGQIWSVNRTSHDVSVFNATSTAIIDTICVGEQNANGTCPAVNPYTYSDMTGLNRAMLIRSGVYQEIINSGYQNQHWGKVTWVQNIPYTDRQSVEVSVRASNTLDANGTLPNGVLYQPAETWNTTPSLRVGQYIEIKVLIRSRVRDNTPVVSNIQIVNP